MKSIDVVTSSDAIESCCQRTVVVFLLAGHEYCIVPIVPPKNCTASNLYHIPTLASTLEYAKAFHFVLKGNLIIYYSSASNIYLQCQHPTFKMFPNALTFAYTPNTRTSTLRS